MSTLVTVERSQPSFTLSPRPVEYQTALQQSSHAGEVEQLFELEHRRIYLLALRLVSDASMAEDVVQEAFLRAWRTWTDFRGESTRATWICGIAIRCALNMLRRDRNAHTFASTEARFGESQLPRPRYEDRIDLERAIAALPSRARMVFVLRDIEGCSVAEVAEFLTIAPGTVKAHLFHARQQLASLLEADD